MDVTDQQVVGTIPRDELLARFQRLNGFLYHYKEATVTYLPPIEMMMIGGPVIHFPQSLIGRLFEKGAPGAAKDEQAALQLAERLVRRDRVLMREMIASQALPRRYYDPAYVWPKFDSAFSEMIGSGGDYTASPSIHSLETRPSVGRCVFIAFHSLGFTIALNDGQYTSAEGIVRVVRSIVHAIIETTNQNVVISAYSEHGTNVLGFFRHGAADPSRIQVVYFDNSSRFANISFTSAFTRNLYRTWRKLRKSTMEGAISLYIRAGVHRSTAGVLCTIAAYRVWLWAANASRRVASRLSDLFSVDSSGQHGATIADALRRYGRLSVNDYRYSVLTGKQNCTEYINKSDEIESVLVPHYYLFPEAVDYKKKIVLYLPDHMPSIMPAGAFQDEILNNAIGRAVARQAAIVITNSDFSAEYLPRSPVRVDRDKIRSFPLPNLNLVGETSVCDRRPSELPEDLKGLEHRYVFYPTQNRPNKRLSVLAEAMNLVNNKLAQRGDVQGGEKVSLVLTCPRDESLVRLANPTPIMFLVGLSNEQLEAAYRHATCLCFTSIAEGNFPTQLTEALSYGVPIVATRMKLITSELKSHADNLLLSDPDDVGALADGVIACLTDRESVLQRQASVREFVMSRGRWQNFAENIRQIFRSEAVDVHARLGAREGGVNIARGRIDR